MSRLFKGYASDYAASQKQPRRVRRFQQRTVTVDWNGALASGDLVEKVTWACTSPWVTYMSAPAIADDQRSVSVNVKFNYPGIGNLKATIQTEAGFQNYEFTFTVTDAPLYPSAQYDSANGPYSVVAEVAPGE